MKFLITGGCGFIGSHLAERLIADEHHVTSIDNLSTGNSANIQSIQKHPHFQLITGNVSNPATTNPLVDQCDIIFHLSAAVGVRLVVENPIQTIQTNIHGAETILSAAAKSKKKVILASSSEVYGKTAKKPFCEEDDLVLGATSKARWSYACSKALNEFLAFAYGKEQKLPIVIARLFNTVGPRQTGKYGMVIPTLVRQALSEKPMTVFGDGSQSRCFVHVQDVVDALISLALEKNATGEIFNVGNPEETSIQNLAKIIKEMTGTSSSIVNIPYDQAYEAGFEDMHQRSPSIAKLQKWTGYKPKFNLRDILKDIIAYEKKQAIS